MRRIYLLSTGGTIEKVYSEQSGVVEKILPQSWTAICACSAFRIPRSAASI